MSFVKPAFMVPKGAFDGPVDAPTHVLGMRCVSSLLGALGLLALAGCAHDVTSPYDTSPPPNYGTATPYGPQQDLLTYEPAPAGYAPVYTELLARHGSRGLADSKVDHAVYEMWGRAQAEGALTELGAKLGPDVYRLIRANELNGYGNETRLGLEEHSLLAKRMVLRDRAFWSAVGHENARKIVVVNSGVERAVDSGNAFVQSLVATEPSLADLVVRPPAPAGYPTTKPIAQPDGTNRFLLYFHKLSPKTDLVESASDPFFTTYQQSLAYEAYLKGPDVAAKKQAIAKDPRAEEAGRVVLERLFTKPFADKVADGTYRFGVPGASIQSAASAGTVLYQLYMSSPAMKYEAAVDMTPYLPAPQADVLAEVVDAQSFYRMGPGIAEKGDATYRMAQILEDDFFDEIDAIAAGDRSHAAKLRFAHAEIVVPFASKLGLRDVLVQVPSAETYSYETNPWRGASVAPMAANVQWDVYAKGDALIVKMLYDEKETDFKAACDGAKIAPPSHYYDYAKLRECYGHAPRRSST